jgi:hypothetical protein
MAVVIDPQTVDNGKPAAGQRIARHERLGEEVERRAVDHHLGFSHGIDHGAAGCIAEHKDVAALCAV